MNETIFNNTELQKAFDISKTNLRSFNQRLDEISSDIKTLEKFLRDMNLQDRFSKDYETEAGNYSLVFDGENLLCAVYGKFTSQSKKLLEHKFDVRMAVYPFLSNFLLYINDMSK